MNVKKDFEGALREHDLSISPEHIFSVAPTMLSSQEDLKAQLKPYLEPGPPSADSIVLRVRLYRD